MKASALESLMQECLELSLKSHSNRGFVKIQASKILMAKTDVVQMLAKIDSAHAMYGKIADNRNCSEAMKGCTLSMLNQHKHSGSVESMHTTTFIALSASTDMTMDWMMKTLAASLTEPEKRDFTES